LIGKSGEYVKKSGSNFENNSIIRQTHDCGRDISGMQGAVT
jgi:hypothetical protein